MKVLAADVGGTVIKLGLVENARVLARERIPALAEQPMETRLEAIAGAWERMLASASLKAHDCSGIGLALPFLIDPSHPRVLGEFGKFPGAASIDFGEWARRRFNLPIAMENDLRVALLGECSSGAAKGYSNVVMIALGTGIGCAVLSNGRLHRGAHNRAGTLFGHSTVQFDGAPARCGNFGCAEDLASTAVLPAIARALPGFERSPLATVDVLDYEAVFNHATLCDPCARAVVEHSLKVWSAVALNAVIAFDPEILVLGGGVMRHPEVITRSIQDHIANHTPGFRWQIPVLAAAQGDDAALLGCERLVADQIAANPT
jgi:glucokinase